MPARKVIVVSRSGYPAPQSFGDLKFDHLSVAHIMRDDERVASADLLILIGAFEGEREASQLAGEVRLILKTQPLTVALAFQERLTAAEVQFVRAIFSELDFRNLPDNAGAQEVTSDDEGFHDFFAPFGRATMYFRNPEDLGLTVIGRLAEHDESPAAAVAGPISRGQLYLLPQRFATQQEEGIRRLASALLNHAEGSSDAPPSYLQELHLPGEEDLEVRKEALASDLYGVEQELAELARMRLLAGHLSDQAFEDLAIVVLNRLLDGTGYRADDREDEGLEDFWILDPDSNDVAICEAKGVGTNARNPHVNQVDNHRDARELGDNFPGLLVINTFRGAHDLSQKRTDISQGVIRLARSHRVTILRGIDLYELLALDMGGVKVGPFLIEKILRGGGGWVRVHNGVPVLEEE